MEKRNILIIHQNLKIQHDLIGRLQKIGWPTISTQNSDHAVTIVKKNPPVITLLDVNSPIEVINSVVQELKSDPLTWTTPIIAITDTMDIESSLPSWATGTLPANAQPAALEATIKWTLARHIYRKPFVLLVDDEPDIIDVMSSALEFQGFMTSGAQNGVEALEIIRAIQPDAMLLDLEMPYMNGWELLHQLQTSPTTQKIKVVILTGVDQRIEDRQEGLKLGAQDYLLKPCDPDEVITALQAALDSRDDEDDEDEDEEDED